MNPKIKKIRKTLKQIWVFCGIAFILFLLVSFQSKGVDKTLLESGNSVKVLQDSYKIAFVPRETIKSSGLIFYPGALVDPKAYVPLARHIAEAGYEVVILKLPFRGAYLASQKDALFSRTREIGQEASAVKHWVLAGHSKGGALAAAFAKDNAGLIDGLILIGTTHPKNFDLSGIKLPVTKILGTQDGLASEKEIREYAKNLPPDTQWVTIKGGNHAQFGYYGFQLGDHRASISRETQQDLLRKAVLQSLEKASAQQSKI